MKQFTVYLDAHITKTGLAPASIQLRPKNFRSSVRGGPVVADVDASGPAVAPAPAA